MLGQLLERAVHAPGEPRRLGVLGRAALAGRLVGRLHRRLRPPARAVDDRVPRDRVEPGAALAAFRVVARGRAPDRGERILERVLGPAAVAEPAQREAEHRPRVAPVELLERVAIAVADALDQLPVRQLPLGTLRMLTTRRARGKGDRSRLIAASMHSVYALPVDPVCSRRPPSTTIVVPVTKSRAGEIEDRLGDVVGRADPPQHRLGRAPLLVVARLDRDRARARPRRPAPRARAPSRATRVSIACAAFAAQCAANDGPRLVGGDVLDHDHEPARLAQVRRRRLGDEEAPLDRRAERRVDVLLRDVLEPLRLESGRGAVDDDVEAAELRRRPLDERPRVVGAREVAVAAPGREHLPALAAQPLRDRGAELAGAAGEERAHALPGPLVGRSNRRATSSQLTTFHQAAR